MLISIVRTVLLYFLVLATFRLLGKRQIGELQPVDLVLTFLLSELLSVSIQDMQAPLLHTLVPVALLVGLEISMSVLSMKSLRFRTLLQGNPLFVIRNGKLDQRQLKRLRFTVDDLLEELRKKDVYDLSEVQYAIVETDGTLSVLLKPGARTPQNDALGLTVQDSGIPCVVVSDGEVVKTNFQVCAMTEEKLENILKKNGLRAGDLLLMTADRGGNCFWVEKEKEEKK